MGLSALLAVLIGAGMLSAWELPSPPSERRSRGQVQEHIVACASRSSCQLRRSETSCHAAEAITQNSLNGVVRCQVVRAPAGNEAISPAVSSSTCPSSISILAAPSKTKNVSLPGRVHCTGPVTSVKRDKPD